MKSIIRVLVVVCIVTLAGVPAFAQQSLVDTVAKGCDKELTTLCKDVTLGEGRGLACLYAYSDKLSGPCEYALYDAAAQLQRAVAALAFVANECGDDMEKYCAAIQPGQGRLLQCLDKNSAKASKRCAAALKEAGLKK